MHGTLRSACTPMQGHAEACLRLCGSQNSNRSFFHSFSSRSSASVRSLGFALLSLAVSATGGPAAAGWPAGVNLRVADRSGMRTGDAPRACMAT